WSCIGFYIRSACPYSIYINCLVCIQKETILIYNPLYNRSFCWCCFSSNKWRNVFIITGCKIHSYDYFIARCTWMGIIYNRRYQFSGWSVLRYSTLSCLTGTLTALFFVLLFSAFGKIDVPEFKAIWTVKYH